MTTETLRALSRIYAAGDMDRETYRLKRRELLEQVVSGQLSVARFELPEPEAPTVFPSDDDEGDTTQEIIPNVEDAAPSAGRFGSTLKVIVVIAILAALAWIGARWYANQSEPALGSAPGNATPVDERNPIAEFLEVESWTAAAVGRLKQEWNALDPSARSRVRASGSMRTMNDAILARIAIQNGLLDLGDASEALDNQDQLLNLADHLGLDNASLRNAREQWAGRRGRELSSADPASAELPFEPPVPEPVADNGAPASGGPTASAPEPQAPSAPANEAVESLPPPLPANEDGLAPAPSDVAAAKPEPQPATVASTDPKPAREPAAGPRSNCEARLARARRPYCVDVFSSGHKGPVLVVLAPGEFEMGGSRAVEQPRHRVAIADSIAFGLFEVSSAELSNFCTATGTSCPEQPWSDSALPVVNVSWHLARAYTDWLSENTGMRYRLPSEAEWEYAARGGTTTRYPFGDELLPTHARHSFKNSLDRPLAANDRSVNRNPFRLFHMIGNVREWVEDPWTDSYAGAPADGSAIDAADSGARVVRGGSFADRAADLRSGARASLAADAGDIYTGFRVVRVIEN